MTILPAAYLPSVRYVARIAAGGCVIDTGEHFLKRSERNRAAILTANGPMSLTVQVAHANRLRVPVRDVRIDYSKRWQHQHWTAIVSAYRSSPYFDHYAPRFEQFYNRRWEWLAEYDLALTQMLLECIGAAMPQVSECYVDAAGDDLDLRPKDAQDPSFRTIPYIQTFADRMEFVPSMSFADLLFCEGPGAMDVLKDSLR